MEAREWGRQTRQPLWESGGIESYVYVDDPRMGEMEEWEKNCMVVLVIGLYRRGNLEEDGG